METAPCASLSVDQVRQLGHLPPGEQVDVDLGYGPNRECHWFGPQGAVELSFGAFLNLQGSGLVPPLPFAVPVTVGGLPTRAGGSRCPRSGRNRCPPSRPATARGPGRAGDREPGDRGARGRSVRGGRTLGRRGLGGRSLRGPVPAHRQRRRRPGRGAQPEEPERQQAGCRWTGPAASLRLVAVLVDPIHDDLNLRIGTRRSAVGSRPVIEELVGTTCTVYARFPFGQLLMLVVDDPAGGAEQACVRARTAAAELLAV